MKRVLLLLVLSIGCRKPAAPRPAGWVKGQTHAHTSRSADSKTPPEKAAKWYAEHGFDFVVFTDHQRVTALADAPLLVIPGVELTQNLETCDPPPEPGRRCYLHVNALFTKEDEVRLSASGDSRLTRFQAALDETRRLGGLAQLNHPNFDYAADAALIAALTSGGLVFVEIANAAIDSNNEGDATHPSTEQLWDTVLTAGARPWGIASDDAHHYEDADAVRAAGETAYVGDRGFVMVRAKRDAAAIRDAMLRGDFYATEGPLLARLERGASLLVEVASGTAKPHAITFVGTGGVVLSSSGSISASFPLASAPRGYVRARIVDGLGRRAWTQPVDVP